MKKIKILTITLAIIAITMVAFFGVYTQVQNRMENQVKENSYAMDLKGSRNVRLKLNTEKETIIKDAEGKTVEEELTDEQIAEKGYTKEEIPYNKEEDKNIENYRASQKVIEKRLKKLGIENYIIKIEEQTGDIILELPENDQTDSAISNIKTTGKFQILDSETKDVLMDNNDIKLAKVMYGSGSDAMSNGTSIYLDIEFNKEGTKKLKEISTQYIKTEDTSTEENTTSEDTSTTESEETTKEKKITMKIDDEEITSTSFDKSIETGKLQLSVGNSATEEDTIQDYVEQATNMATILDTGNMPLKYDVDENQYILSEITGNEVQIMIYAVLAIIIVGIIILFIRYKSLGALGTISYIGLISLFMLGIRYTNVVLSIEGILGIIIVFILNYILVSKLLAKSNNKKEVYKEFFVKIIPISILAIVFCFAGWMPISSFGMVMFWGIVFIMVYNSIITNSLLRIQTRKEK